MVACNPEAMKRTARAQLPPLFPPKLPLDTLVYQLVIFLSRDIMLLHMEWDGYHPSEPKLPVYRF